MSRQSCGLLVVLAASVLIWLDSFAEVQCQLLGALGGMMGGNPKIAVKIMPSKKMRMSKNDMNSLLLDLRHEIRKQVNELEDQYAEKERLRQKTGNVWSLHGAPIFVPNNAADKTVTPHGQTPHGQTFTPMEFRQVESAQSSVNSSMPSEDFKTADLSALMETLVEFSKLSDASNATNALQNITDTSRFTETDKSVNEGPQTTTSDVKPHLRNGPVVLY